MSESAGAGPARVGLAEIVWAYFRITMSSFGGGLSGWAHTILVREKGWLDETRFLSSLAMARIMPGANQVNLAVIVGTRLRGAPGAIAAVFGLTIGPFVLLLGLGHFYFDNHAHPLVTKALGAMAAAAAGLAFSVGFETGRVYWIKPIPLALAAAAFLTIGILHWPMLPTLAVLTPLSIYWAWTEDGRAAAPAPAAKADGGPPA